MGAEDLSLSMFIIGTAIGYLGWYAAFRQLHRSRRYSPLRPEELLFYILFISCIITLFFFSGIYLLLGARSLFIYSKNRWTVSLPLGTLALGIFFGGIGGEWIRYILNPTKLRTSALRASHKRWGYVLIGLLIVGLGLPILPQLLAPFESASITTPVATVSLAKQSTETHLPDPNSSENAQSVNQTGASRAPWPSLPALSEMIDRDNSYTRMFAKSKADRDAIKALADSNAHFINDVLVPVGKCIRNYVAAFHNANEVRRQFFSTVVQYRKLLLSDTSETGATLPPPDTSETGSAPLRRSPLRKMLDSMALATQDLANDLSGEVKKSPNETEREKCQNAHDKLTAAEGKPWTKDQLELRLPYSVLGLAFLYYDSDEIDAGIRIIAQWINEQARSTTHDICVNSPTNVDCNQRGYLTGSGDKVTWHPMPLWYLVRAKYELADMLGSTNAIRTTFQLSRETVNDMEVMFKESKIESAQAWLKDCRIPSETPIELGSQVGVAVAEPSTVSTEREHSDQERLVISYITMVDQMLRYLSQLVDLGELDEETMLTPTMLAYAESNTYVDFACLPSIAQRGDDGVSFGEELRAKMFATYGILLAQAAIKRESGREGLSQIERAGRTDTLRRSATALDLAIPLLAEQIDRERVYYDNLPLQDQLFYQSDQQVVLARAKAKRGAVEAMLR